MDNLYVFIFILTCFTLIILFVWLLIIVTRDYLPAVITCNMMNWHSDVDDINYDDLDGDNRSDIIGRCAKCHKLIRIGPDGTWQAISKEMEKAWIKDYIEEQKE